MNSFVQLNPARIDSILDAGLRLALAYGFRGTSMEAIAKEAGVAKATLYKYFPNKEAIFTTITASLFDEMKALVENNLSMNIDIDEKIANALIAIHKNLFHLIDGSPHSADILSQKAFSPSKFTKEFELWLQNTIFAILENAGHEEPQIYAQVLIASSEGISRSAISANQIELAIRLVVNKILV